MNSFYILIYLNRELFKMIEDNISIDLLSLLYSSQLVTNKQKMLDENRVYYRLLKNLIKRASRDEKLRAIYYIMK